MKKASLFSGIGGIDLAAKWAGMTTVAFCEIEPFCQRVLRKHWPDVPIIIDVRNVKRKEMERHGIGTIDIISAGYPCQPFSVAGKRAGAADDRHLWPEVKRILSEIRPRWFVGENVAGHITLGLDDVLADLENIGYTTQAFVIPAAAVRASHRRDRVFIVAYAARELSHRCREAWEWRDEYSDSGQIVAYTNSKSGLETGSPACAIRRKRETWNDAGRGGRRCGATQYWWLSQSRMGRGVDELSAWLDGGMNPLDAIADFITSYPQPALIGQPQYDWESPRVATGVKNRAARLKALGNAVDPLQIYPIMYGIKLIDDYFRMKRGNHDG